MDFTNFLISTGWGCLKNILLMMAIIIPLMIAIEIFVELDLLQRLTGIMTPFTRLMGMSRESNTPLLAGIIFGISYGAGIIIYSARNGSIETKEIFTINLFLVICHSIFEDTLLFAVLGAYWLPIVVTRFALAVVVCTLWVRLSRIWLRMRTNA